MTFGEVRLRSGAEQRPSCWPWTPSRAVYPKNPERNWAPLPRKCTRRTLLADARTRVGAACTRVRFRCALRCRWVDVIDEQEQSRKRCKDPPSRPTFECDDLGSVPSGPSTNMWLRTLDSRAFPRIHFFRLSRLRWILTRSGQENFVLSAFSPFDQASQALTSTCFRVLSGSWLAAEDPRFAL